MFKWFKTLFLLALTSTLVACSSDDSPPNVVEVAQNDPRFSVLVEAVVAADLTSTLTGPGPFTVFAPTNDAFALLLTELGISKAQLLADKALLKTVLTYHVLPAKVMKSEVPPGKALSSVQGGVFKIDAVGSDLIITDGRNRSSKIILADVSASNGVIHAIDKVLLPANKTVVETAIANPDFSILVEAVTAANLGATLSGAGPFTVFAPTNAAFASLLTELGISKDALLANKTLLAQVLTYHVVSARVLKAEVQVGSAIKSLQGETFTIDSSLNVNDQRARKAKIVATDVFGSNGVIHVIDKVILPKP